MTGTEITVAGMLVIAVTALSGVVAHLYRAQEKRSQLTDEKLDDCEKDRERMWRAMAQQTNRTVEQVKRDGE